MGNNLWNQYEIALENFVSFISNQMLFDEMIVNLFYYKKVTNFIIFSKDGDFEVNTYIRDIYKKQRFKWLKLENTIDERFVKMSKKFNDKTESCKEYKVNSKFLLSLQYYLTLQIGGEKYENEEQSNQEAHVNIMPLLCILNGMRSDYNIDQPLINKLDENKFIELNNKYVLKCKNNTDSTMTFLENIDLDHRGKQTVPKLEFVAESELTTSVLKLNTRIENMSSMILDIDGSNIIFNKINVKITYLINILDKYQSTTK